MTATVEERLSFVESELIRLRELVESPRTAANLAIGSNHPLAPLAGRLRDNPYLDSWREIIEEQRRQLDETEGVA